MNRIEDLISAAFEEDARHAPESGPVVTRVLAFETRRRRPTRHRWLAAAAAAAVAATIVAVGVARVGDGQDIPAGTTTLTGSGGFEQRRVAYAEGSIVHYGDRTIDVAPHRPIALVQTDDGFVFATATGATDRYDVYLANGDGVELIGQAAGFTAEGVLADSGSVLVSDDTGSYVGWVDQDDAVVYDTARHTEVLRTPIPYPEEGELGARSVAAIDDGSAYVASLDSVDVWDLSTGTKTATITREGPADILSDVADGHYLWSRLTDPVAGIVSRNPYAEQPALRDKVEGLLSPDAGHLAGGEYWVVDRKTLEDVTPEGHGVVDQAFVQWLDDDRYVADTSDQASSGGVEPHDLLVCSVAAGSCQPAVESVGEIVYPDGVVPPWVPRVDDE
jgi:hypothetical protein